MRQEVQEGLTVVGSWNSTNGFIFYGKAGEFAANRRENQEISLRCLHLLQASLIYINTLMIQEILGDPKWLDRMTIRDPAALSPSLTLHINSYG
ncbi:MAG: Tn3 family transposase [Syntrophobacteraceae bacterium]